MKFMESAGDIDKNLIKAQQEDKLVIFADAGISMPSPSNFPNFTRLAEKLAYSSGLTIEENEPIDRFLGRLSKKNLNDPYVIHKNTINILSDSSSSYNELHSGILLNKYNILAAAIRPPTVETPRIRLCTMAQHSEADLDYVVKALSELVKRHKETNFQTAAV